MKEIVLCGVCHVDIKGGERLKKILEKEKPDCITLETAIEYLGKQIQRLKTLESKKLSLVYGTRKIEYTPFKQSEIIKMNRETLSQFFSQILFEIKIAKEYADKNKICLLCVEKKGFSDASLMEITKDIKKGTIYYFSAVPAEVFTFSIEYFSKFVDGFYTKAYPYLNGDSKEKELMEKRDKYSANEILKIKAKKILHIGGLAHIYGDHKNLFKILRDKEKNVRRIMLNEADKL